MRERTQTALYLWKKVIWEDTQGKRSDCRSYLEVCLEDVFSRSSDQFTDSYFLPKRIKNRDQESVGNNNEKYTLLLKWAFIKICRRHILQSLPCSTELFCIWQHSWSRGRAPCTPVHGGHKPPLTAQLSSNRASRSYCSTSPVHAHGQPRSQHSPVWFRAWMDLKGLKKAWLKI